MIIPVFLPVGATQGAGATQGLYPAPRVARRILQRRRRFFDITVLAFSHFAEKSCLHTAQPSTTHATGQRQTKVQIALNECIQIAQPLVSPSPLG